MLPRPQDKSECSEHQQCWGQTPGSGISVSVRPGSQLTLLVVTSLGPHHLLSLSFPACEMGTLALNLDIVPGQEAKPCLSKLGVEKVASWV